MSSEQSNLASAQSNQKVLDNHSELKQLKNSNSTLNSAKNQNIQVHQQQDLEKKSHVEGISNGGVKAYCDSQNQSSNNSIERGGDKHHHQNSSQNQLKHHQHMNYMRSEYGYYFGDNSYISFCKNHSTKEATKICLHAGCALTREICDYCEKQQPHASHPQSIVDAKKFFVDVELGLKQFRMNSPLMNASEMLEQARQFILRHFQSMKNMLVEKSHKLVTMLALIEQTESAKRTPMKTYELERFIRDVMDIFQIHKSGKLESHHSLQLLDQDIIKEEISSVLFMIRDLENVVRDLHDDFAKALKFGDYGYYAGMERHQNHAGKQQIQNQESKQNHNYNNQATNPSNNGHYETREYSKSVSDNGNKSQNINTSQGNASAFGQTAINQPSSYPHNYDNLQFSKNSYSQLNQKDNSAIKASGNQKGWGQQQFHPTSYNMQADIENQEGSSNPNQKKNTNQLAILGSASLIPQTEFSADVFMDPAFLKRPRGRPKGSKCKRKGKYKGKFTDEQKLQILSEVGKSKSVQVIAEKYSIQNSLIRYWARQLKYELDPQTVSSRRPYRTFSREKKKVIVNEAIKRRDIVMVAQEYDVNAQVLKRWILKSAQGILQSQEMRQMMNAVPNIAGDEEEDDNSGDDSDLHSDEEDDDSDDDEEEDDDEDEDEMVDEQNQNRDDQLFGRQNNRTQDNDSSNNQFKHGKKINSPLQKLSKKQLEPHENNVSNNSNSFNNLYNQNDAKQKIEVQVEDIEVKYEENNNTQEQKNKQDQQTNLPQLQNQLSEKDSRKRRKIEEEESEEEDSDEEDESEDEEEGDYSSSHNAVSKKQKIETNKSENDNKQNISPNQQNGQSSKNKSNMNLIDANINDILNSDILKTVGLKNLDLSMDTQAQSEQLLMMQKKIEEELLKMKQQQKEAKLKKEKSEQKKQVNLIQQKQNQQNQQQPQQISK
ncbi:hypothetical protein ABPG74_001848 [Tetrahymena malaccensis]